MTPEARFREAVEQLALQADEAVAKLRAEHATADVWIECFDEAYTTFVEHLTSLPDDRALICAQVLDDALSRLTDPQLAELRTEAAVRSHETWEEIRALASAVIDVFGWND